MGVVLLSPMVGGFYRRDGDDNCRGNSCLIEFLVPFACACLNPGTWYCFLCECAGWYVVCLPLLPLLCYSQ